MDHVGACATDELIVAAATDDRVAGIRKLDLDILRDAGRRAVGLGRDGGHRQRETCIDIGREHEASEHIGGKRPAAIAVVDTRGKYGTDGQAAERNSQALRTVEIAESCPDVERHLDIGAAAADKDVIAVTAVDKVATGATHEDVIAAITDDVLARRRDDRRNNRQLGGVGHGLDVELDFLLDDVTEAVGDGDAEAVDARPVRGWRIGIGAGRLVEGHGAVTGRTHDRERESIAIHVGRLDDTAVSDVLGDRRSDDGRNRGRLVEQAVERHLVAIEDHSDILGGGHDQAERRKRDGGTARLGIECRRASGRRQLGRHEVLQGLQVGANFGRQLCRREVQLERVVASLTVDRVGALTHDMDQGIVAGAAVQNIVAGPTDECVVTAIAIQTVVAIPTGEEVVQAAAVERVITGSAVEGVVPVLADEHVIAIAAVDEVVAGAGIHSVVATVHADDVISGGSVDALSRIRPIQNCHSHPPSPDASHSGPSGGDNAGQILRSLP